MDDMKLEEWTNGAPPAEALDDWRVYELALRNPDTFPCIYVAGAPGCGKTYSALHVAPPKVVECVTLQQDMGPRDLFMQQSVEAGTSRWIDGPATRAMKAERSRLILNELPNASADVLSASYALLESSETSTFALPDGSTVTKGGALQIVVTGNQRIDTLDPIMRDALASRLTPALWLEGLPPEAVAWLPAIFRNVARSVAMAPGDARVDLRAWVQLMRIADAIDAGDVDMTFHDAARIAFGRNAASVIEALETEVD